MVRARWRRGTRPAGIRRATSARMTTPATHGHQRLTCLTTDDTTPLVSLSHCLTTTNRDALPLANRCDRHTSRRIRTQLERIAVQDAVLVERERPRQHRDVHRGLVARRGHLGLVQILRHVGTVVRPRGSHHPLPVAVGEYQHGTTALPHRVGQPAVRLERAASREVAAGRVRPVDRVEVAIGTYQSMGRRRAWPRHHRLEVKELLHLRSRRDHQLLERDGERGRPPAVARVTLPLRITRRDSECDNPLVVEIGVSGIQRDELGRALDER